MNAFLASKEHKDFTKTTKNIGFAIKRKERHFLCSLCKSLRSLCAKIAAAFVLCSMSALAQEMSLSFRLEPDLAVYYVGQQVTGILTIDAGGYELHGNTAIANFVSPGDAARYGAFTQRSARNARQAVYATPIVFQKDGELTFAPAINGQVSITETRGFFQQSRIAPFRAAAEPLRVRVETLPRTQLGDFIGAIGVFTLEASLEPRLCSPGDLLNLRWSLTGESAFNSPLEVRYSPGADFRVYPPVADPASAPGAVLCRQVVIPQNTNATVAAALEVCVFNPVRGEYEVLRAGPFGLEITERGTVDVANVLVLTNNYATTEKKSFSLADLFGRKRGEEFVTAARMDAKLLPDARSRTLFEVPGGSTLEIRDQKDDWVFVLYEGASGWIRK